MLWLGESRRCLKTEEIRNADLVEPHEPADDVIDTDNVPVAPQVQEKSRVEQDSTVMIDSVAAEVSNGSKRTRRMVAAPSANVRQTRSRTRAEETSRITRSGAHKLSRDKN